MHAYEDPLISNTEIILLIRFQSIRSIHHVYAQSSTEYAVIIILRLTHAASCVPTDKFLPLRMWGSIHNV